MAPKNEHTSKDPAPHHTGDALHVMCAVVTVSDTRTVETDEGGAVLARRLEQLGHRVVQRAVVPDDVPAIRAAALEAADRADIEAVLFTGGTGLAPRDVTPEAVEPLLSKRMPGFCDLFVQISYAEVGPNALLSRAVAGIIGRTAVFCVPGAPGACRIAMDKLIGPVLGHLVGLMRRSAAP